MISFAGVVRDKTLHLVILLHDGVDVIQDVVYGFGKVRHVHLSDVHIELEFIVFMLLQAEIIKDILSKDFASVKLGNARVLYQAVHLVPLLHDGVGILLLHD